MAEEKKKPADNASAPEWAQQPETIFVTPEALVRMASFAASSAAPSERLVEASRRAKRAL